LTDVVVCVVGTRSHTPPGTPIRQFASRADALAATAPADVVLLTPGCQTAAGWLERLRDAAYAGSTTATATALTQHDLDTGVEDLEQAAAAVGAASLRLRPRIEAPGNACVYVRRSAIDLVGATGEDFAERCVAQGLAHVLADDVLVLDSEPAHEAPDPPTEPEARATSAARRALRPLSVTVDARILSGPTTGTQVHVLELIAGLARTGRMRLTAIVPDAPSEDALARLKPLTDVKLVTYREATGRTDIVHRPFQLSNAGDLGFLRTLGDRLILTQQDLIAFHNPAYFPTADAWHGYRHLTNVALAAADRVLFFSAYARADALAEDLVDPARADVVHLGVDHPGAAQSHATAPQNATESFMLRLGTDFLHKNRVFVLRVLERLKADHGWNGTLILAGPPVAHGSSRSQESEFLASHPKLRDHVRDLGAVTEPEKNWLYGHAKLVVYPTVLEGFGLVPFEAAAHRVPCLWAPGTSLSELLPDEAAGIVPWNDARTAEHALTLMRDVRAGEQNLAAIDAAAANLTWDATAHGLYDVYEATAEAPAQRQPGVTLSEDAARLVGPGGELPEDVHRPLLALATHPRIARPAWRALRLGYRASHRLRQRRK
jgi:glycosyltransferase involved in cell wall biosynthesis